MVEMIADVLDVGHPGDSRGVLLDIGDDTAAWKPGSDVELATTDTMVEDVHFRTETSSYRDLGWKALAINLSDIAAMGGVPRYALVSLGLSPDTEGESVVEMYRGMKEIGEEFGCRVIGGDTVGAPCMMINVTLIGEAFGSGEFLRRDGARAGDLIAVTGWLGSSGAGFRVLNGDTDVRGRSRAAGGSAQSTYPQGNRRAGPAQSRRTGGDGPERRFDVRPAEDMCDERVEARVSIGRLPVSGDVREVFGPEAVTLALTAGEDYELLVAGSREALERAAEEIEIPLTVIGEMVEGGAGTVTLLGDDGLPVEAPKSGWEHFSKP